MKTLTPAQIEALSRAPGQKGALWRLAQKMGPSVVGEWAATEADGPTPLDPKDMVYCLAEIMAADTCLLGMWMSDPRAAIMGEKGIVAAYQNLVNQKLTAELGGMRQTEGGLFVPVHLSALSVGEVKKGLKQ